MPDVLALAWETPGLFWIFFAGFLAGMVRGFSGFGTAMIFLPVAGQFLPPLHAILVLVVMDAFGPLPNLRRAAADCVPGDVARLLVATGVMLPVGLALLLAVDPAIFRYSVSVIALVLLVCLVMGFRYRGTLSPPKVFGIGGVAGFMGGMAGIPGPPVILFYMASPLPAWAIRANTMLFLFGFDLMFLCLLAVRGDLVIGPVVIGLMTAVPVMLGNVIGAAIFRPDLERLYRAAAYVIILVSALRGLPLWG